MSSFDSTKFTFHETFKNQDGKTSGSGFVGVITGLVACACMVAAMIGYFLNLPNTLEVMGVLLKMFGIVALLLGVRKVSSVFGKNGNGDNDDDDNADPAVAQKTDPPILEVAKK
jgi:thiol:disulfide interchange protein